MTPIRSALSEAEPTSTSLCFGANDRLLREYHDQEWGRPVHTDAELLEILTLIGFQSGLSWRLVLTKRPALREALRDFEPRATAAITDAQIGELARDPRIIRNPRKLRAAVTNARAVVNLHEQGTSLVELVASHAPGQDSRGPAPQAWTEVPTQTAESESLALALRSIGFRFLGPVNAYSAMQSCGLVNDHLAGCPVRLEAVGAS